MVLTKEDTLEAEGVDVLPVGDARVEDRRGGLWRDNFARGARSIQELADPRFDHAIPGLQGFGQIATDVRALGEGGRDFGHEARLNFRVHTALLRQYLHRYGASDGGIASAVNVREPATQDFLHLILYFPVHYYPRRLWFPDDLSR